MKKTKYYSNKKMPISITEVNGRYFLNEVSKRGKIISSGHIIESEAKKIIKEYKLKPKVKKYNYTDEELDEISAENFFKGKDNDEIDEIMAERYFKNLK